jgi:hypothetical protein
VVGAGWLQPVKARWGAGSCYRHIKIKITPSAPCRPAADADRSLLLQQLRTLAGDAAAPELAALTAAMDEGSFGQHVEEGLSGQDVHSALQGLRGEHRRISDVGMQQLLADEAELLPASMSRQLSLQEQEEHLHEAAAAAAAAGGGGETHS